MAFEGREISRVPDVLGEIVPDVGAKLCESAKAMGFATEALDFEHLGERSKRWTGTRMEIIELSKVK